MASYRSPRENVILDGVLIIPVSQQTSISGMELFSYKKNEKANVVDVQKDITKITIPDLKSLCKTIGLANYSTLKKKDLVQLVQNHIHFETA